MEYIISDYDKKTVSENIMDTGHYNEVMEILDNLQQVELVAEGKVYYDNEILGTSFVGDTAIDEEMVKKYKGNNIKIYIQKET